VVLAAGWKPYHPTKLNKRYGYGLSPDVITNVMFEESYKDRDITRPSDGKELENVAFLHCAGSRDQEYLPNCSSICCTASLKQALRVKRQNPDANVYSVYRELRTPGQAEDIYRKAQEEGVIFIRCQTPEVKVSGGLSVEAEDELLGDTILLEDLDMVVLATGMVPSTAFGEDMYAKIMAEGEEEEKPQG